MKHSPSTHALLAVGQAPVLAHGHGLLLDVVLGEEPRLARDHLLDGGWDHHVIDVIVRPPGLPLLGRNHLEFGGRTTNTALVTGTGGRVVDFGGQGSSRAGWAQLPSQGSELQLQERHKTDLECSD